MGILDVAQIMSNLCSNPFVLLGATPRDDRRRIVALATEKALDPDYLACQKARSDLTGPKRLTAEVAYLPGVPPERAVQFLDSFRKNPKSIRAMRDLPTLAHLNLIAATCEVVKEWDSVNDVAMLIQQMATLAAELSAQEILFDINEDRLTAGFPQIHSVKLVEAKLSEQMRYYRNVIKGVLNQLSTASLVEAMAIAVDHATLAGEDLPPELIDRVVDSYAVEAQGFFSKEAENIQRLISASWESAKFGEPAIEPIIESLLLVARNWAKVARPIQLRAKAIGIRFEPGYEVANAIHAFAVGLFNKYGMLNQPLRILALLRSLFFDFPGFCEQVEENAKFMNERSRQMTYHVDMGKIFKKRLSISPEEVVWKSRHYRLDRIQLIRWFEIPSRRGVRCRVDFVHNRSSVTIRFKDKYIYTEFVERLLQSTQKRLLADVIHFLNDGNVVCLGSAILCNNGVTFKKYKFIIFPVSPVHCTWDQVHYWSENEAFFFGDKNDRKTYSGFPSAGWSLNVLKSAICMACDAPGIRKLSDALSNASSMNA